MNTQHTSMTAAIQYADYRAARDGQDMVVYHVARDQWGRDAVFYVRPITAPCGDIVPYDTVYRAKARHADAPCPVSPESKEPCPVCGPVKG